MSQKTKQKDKKSDLSLENDRKYEEAMGELLDKDRMLKQAQEKALRLGLELHKQKTENTQLKKYIKQEFQKLTLTNDNLRNRLTELTSNKNQLQLQVATFKAKLQFQRKEHDEWRKEKEREYEQSRRHYATELGRYQVQATDYAISINQRQGLLAQRTHLLEMLEEERQEFKKRLADRDRDKIQALDNLKKSMKDRVQQMKTSLLSIRRQQLDNNTRLTLLQNHQLLQQLEYQSVNTQTLLDKNIEMERKIKELENQLEIKQDIEKEIAKRSLISKKVIKTFQEKAICLEKENYELAQENGKTVEKNEENEKLSLTITQLSRTLESAHRKIQQLQKQVTDKTNQILVTKSTLKEYQHQKQSISQLMNQYYSQIINKKSLQVDEHQIDIHSLQKRQVKQWQKWEIQIIVESILDKFRNNITPGHLQLTSWRKVADSRVQKLLPSTNKQNILEKELKQIPKCDSSYVRSLSLQKNKLYYQNRRRLSDKKQRSLTKINSQHSISFGKYVQGNLREWGQQVKPASQKAIAERFMKPNIKQTLKK